jgi:hypothetical protein
MKQYLYSTNGKGELINKCMINDYKNNPCTNIVSPAHSHTEETLNHSLEIKSKNKAWPLLDAHLTCMRSILMAAVPTS